MRDAWGPVCVAALLAVGCARNAASPTTALVLFPPQPVVQAGGNIQLRADPARGPLRWTSSDTTIATVQFGLAQGIAAGTVQISATDGVDTGSIALTVTASNTVPTLSGDIQPIFTNYCVSCHEQPGAQENIDLSSGSTSYSNLVNQPSPSTGNTLVVPNDTTNSYLYSMLRGRASDSDDNMPQGCTPTGQSPCLPAPLVQLIASWILNGAKP
jgi:hypothetical protein